MLPLNAFFFFVYLIIFVTLKKDFNGTLDGSFPEVPFFIPFPCFKLCFPIFTEGEMRMREDDIELDSHVIEYVEILYSNWYFQIINYSFT